MIQQPKKLASFLKKVGNEIARQFEDNHVSTILHGGIVLKEFSLPYSDIDLVVVMHQLTHRDLQDLSNLWNGLAQKHPFGEKLWINVFERDLLQTGHGTSWTISKKGIRPSQGMPIDGMELHTLLNHGKTLKGENIIPLFPQLAKDYQIRELGTFLRVLETYSTTSPLQPQFHQSSPIDDEISIILSFPRYLYNLQTDMILTKSRAAKWYAQKYTPFRADFLSLARYRIDPQSMSPKKVFAIYEKAPKMVSYFWKEYFKHLGVNHVVPDPPIFPHHVQYDETFREIRVGLHQLLSKSADLF
ncbi:hypothetical protein ABLT31_08260 [Ammoniphilus sp. 3BR4]